MEYSNFRRSLSISSNKDPKVQFDAFTKVLNRSKNENSNNNNGNDEDKSNDLFRSIREMLIVGRCLGVIPISGVFKRSYSELNFRRKSVAAITSLVITIILSLNLVLALIQWVRANKRNALEIAYSIHRTAQYCWGWVIYVSFLTRGNQFLELFRKWVRTSSLIFYSVEDRTLRRDSILICLLILLSCIMENGVLHLEYFKELDYLSGVQEKYKQVTHSNQTWLETYYWRSNSHWGNILGYNPFFAVISFIQHKWMLYSWNYLDVILAIFGRALYFKFKVLYELSNQHLAEPLKKGGAELAKSNKVMNRDAWMQIVNDHKALYELLQEMEEFFSPLVFGSYAVNIYYLCIQLLIGLSPDISVTSLVQMIYGPWSFLHMAVRIYVVSLCVARINLYAHQLRKVFADCPIEIYQGEISRVDKRITSGPPIGITGLQCFVVTYPFLLSIVAVVFTFEIVLLQGTSAPPGMGSNATCCCGPK